jgi:hypothetical protein
VDGRDEPGHDDAGGRFPLPLSREVAAIQAENAATFG